MAQLSGIFTKVLDLYNESMFLSAWEIGKPHGPLESWPGTEARVLAGRLAPHLGAPRLSNYLHINALRADPTNANAQYFYVWWALNYRGGLHAWHERTRLGAPTSNDSVDHCDYHGQCAAILGTLRDFERAEDHTTRALEAVPDRSWAHIERARLYEREDRYGKALEAAQHALELDPTFHSAVHAVAYYHRLLDQPAESIALLRNRAAVSESSGALAFLIELLMDEREFDDVPRLLDAFERVTPLREKTTNQWVHAKRADYASETGDLTGALEHMEEIDHPYYETVRSKLRTFVEGHSDKPRRAFLNVPFIRQHHMTCAPATLSALSKFWNKPAEHLAVAEAICYDGTPWHSERQWAEEQGWVVREFTIDWPSAMMLIERRVPFTLTTTQGAQGHLQAVVGFDEALGVLMIRDPFVTSIIETNAEQFLKSQRVVGPRGMAIVPDAQAALMDGIELVDAEHYDLYHRFHIALSRHDRSGATEELQIMRDANGAHRLTLMAALALASYDSNQIEAERALTALLEQFPDDSRIQAGLLDVMRESRTRDARLEWLREITDKQHASPLMLVELGVELSSDDRESEQAMWYVRRGLRRQPDTGIAVYHLATLHWKAYRRSEALELFRFAACLEDRQEGMSQAYFTAARALGETEAALSFLQNRVAQLGTQSSQAAMSLFWALDQLGRSDEAFSILERALDVRPDDGDLMVFAAARFAEYGELDQAHAAIEAAEGKSPWIVWLRAAAQIDRISGLHEAASRLWKQVLEVDPADFIAHREIALLESERSSPEAAREHLGRATSDFPYHVGLLKLYYDWTSDQPAEEREAVLRRLLDIDTADAWVHRELAMNMKLQVRLEEALEFADQALTLEPLAESGHSVRGSVLHMLGRRDEAAEAYRTAIQFSADAQFAIHQLIDIVGDDLEKRKQAVFYVESQLIEQPMFGEGVLTFREAARGVLTPGELLLSLRNIHRQRPDLWHAWSALGQHLAHMGSLDEALDIATEATERFPRLPHVWLDLGSVHRERMEIDDEIAAMTRCVEMSPMWSHAVLALCGAHERNGGLEESEQVLERGLHHTPLATELRAALANLYHRTNRKDQALEAVRRVLRTSPDNDWAWHTLSDWIEEDGDRTSIVEEAVALAESRPVETQQWIRLGEIQMQQGDYSAAITSLDKALAIDPTHSPAWDTKAQALVQLGSFAEAVDTLESAPFPEGLPLNLRGRIAWVHAQRGDVTGAIATMEKLVEISPDYLWGWYSLAEWYEQRGRHEDCMRATERLVWLDPDNPVPHGWLGSMKRQSGDSEGAAEVFRRAMHMHPRYTYAGRQLFELQCESKDYGEAEHTIEVFAQFAPEDSIIEARAFLEVARGNGERALSLMRQLASNLEVDGDVITRTATTLTDGGHRDALLPMLRELLEEGTAHPMVAPVWAFHKMQDGKFLRRREYRWLASLGDPGRDAIFQVLNILGEHALDHGKTQHWRTRQHLQIIRKACQGWRESDDQYFGKVGYVLARQARFGLLEEWMQGWHQRENIEPWMLQNLALAHLMRKHDVEAIDLLLAAGKAITAFDSSPTLRIWCAIAAAVRGQFPLAERLLHETPPDIVDDDDRSLYKTARLATDFLATPIGTTPTKDQERALKLATTGISRAGLDRLIHIVHHEFAKHTKDPLRVVGAWWRTSRPPIWVLVLLGYLLLRILIGT